MPEASLTNLPPSVPSAEDCPNTLFGADYYQHGCGPIPYAHTEHWLTFFGSLADEIIRTLRPSRVFDAGCAMGLLVEAFWDRGVDARGLDISSYAISNVRRDMQPYCRVGSLAEPIEGFYDLITCIEVLEHLSSEDGLKALENMCRATDTIFFSSTANDFTEPTHFNVRPPIHWLKLFAGFGFQPVLQYNCDTLIPHAMLLRRTSKALPEEALELFADHMRTKSLLTQQALQIRELTRLNSQEELGKALAASEAERDSLRQQFAEMARQRAAENAAAQASWVSFEERQRQTLVSFQTEFAALREQQRLAAAAEEQTASQLADLSQKAATAGDAIARLTALQAGLQGQFGTVLDRTERSHIAFEQLQMGMGDIRAKLSHIGVKLESILQSRIWRSLRAAGGVMLNLAALPRIGGAVLRKHTPPGAGPIVTCDEPPENDRPRTGKIRVAGWAVSPVRVDRVEISVDDGPPRQAEFGLARPDVAQNLPHLPATYSGFFLELDSSSLSTGNHVLTVRAWDSAGDSQKVTRSFQVDHESGDDDGYGRWMKDFESRDPEMLRLKMTRFAEPPLISIIVPVFKTQPEFLKRAIESVIAQSYSHWELCLADDGSQSEELDALLHRYSRQDPRIRVTFRKERGGIAAASNTALELTSGAWIGLLDHDDELAPDALFYAAEAIAASPERDLIYSDEDKISEEGYRYDPFFKPDWSPDLLKSENYICHFLVFRKSLLARTGPFRSECDGSQDYDLILRLTEVSRSIYHIPRVLYHWRSVPASTASSSTVKGYAVDAAQRALSDHLQRAGSGTTVERGLHAGRWRVRYAIPKDTKVSIIVASGGNCDVLKSNLESLASKTTYPHYEIVVIDNSRANKIEQYIGICAKRMPNVRYIDWRHKPFNYSAINNAAARQCDSPVLLFLNDDTSVIAPGWLTAMLELVMRPEVGAVGAKLLYPGRRIQHAGVVMGVFDNCGHAFKGLDGTQQHYFDLPDVIRNVSAVTGACLMTRTEVFWKVGGFDEDRLQVAFNDIDLCLKIGRAGYRVLYTPHALLTHHEAFSKTESDLIPHPREVAEMQAKWADVIAADPFYSPNLSRTTENYSFRQKQADSGSQDVLQPNERSAIAAR